MKAANLFEATQVLQRAKHEVLGVEHEIDRRVSDAYGIEQPDLNVMLLEHDKPAKEVFPNKENQKYVEPKIKGNTSLTEIEKRAGL